ncbi:hypothetical protein B0H14DRAFT_2596476 [Mycena olivaceomarginata]|nr:hypothetical protein B0H14DRAFT_2596476 [Mycena olivaceomarginata]
MHSLWMGRQGKVSETRMGDRGNARTSWRREGKGKDEKARESERDKDRGQRKSTDCLQTRRRGKVSETRMGDRGKHGLPRDEKARESERGEDGGERKSTHELETRRRGKRALSVNAEPNKVATKPIASRNFLDFMSLRRAIRSAVYALVLCCGNEACGWRCAN